MTEPRYTPQMVVATLCVLLLPAGLVWVLHSRGAVTSWWLGLLFGLALTLIVLTVGSAYWRRRRHPATVLFSELLVWGWIRHRYLDHKLRAALRSLAELRADDSARRTQLLTEIAAAVEAKDPFLYGHSRRTARYVIRVARRMRLDRSQVSRFGTAALLHDVGKLHTPPEVLHQPRRLNAEETAVMRRHVEDGAEMVAALGDPNLVGVVRHHHERFDGMGYPAGLEGEAIPLGSRIIAVPDAFDAIITTRPYRRGLPHKDALNVLRDEAGEQFDPAVVRAFFAEYTDRRGTMVWASAGQLIPVLRVGVVAAAEIVLSAVAFAAGAPDAHTPPRVRAAAALNSAGMSTSSGPTQPRVSPRAPARRTNAQGGESVATRSEPTQQPSPGLSRSAPPAFRAELTSARVQSTLPSPRASRVQGMVAPAALHPPFAPARTTRAHSAGGNDVFAAGDVLDRLPELQSFDHRGASAHEPLAASDPYARGTSARQQFR